MYYSTISSNQRAITRNSACRYLSQNTRIPDHIYGIATEALQDLPQGLFLENRKLHTVCFHPDSQIQTIRKNTFGECKSLSSLILPDSITDIEDRAFYRCRSLQSVSFPEKLKRIGGQAFYFCNFTSLELPDSLEILEDSAFFKCNNLEYVHLPQNVRHIGKWAFHGCNRLKVLEIRHDPEYIGDWIINRSAAIRCYRGSRVDQYCREAGFKVEYLD